MPENHTIKKTITRPPAPTNMTAFMRKTVTEVEPGVVLFVADDPNVVPYARVMVERAILERTPIADLPMPGAKALRALYSSDSRAADLAETLHRRSPPVRQITERHFCVRLPHCRNFSGMTNEGAHLLLEHLGDGECVTALHAVNGAVREEMAGVLGTLDNAAKARKGLVALFVHWPHANDIAWVRHHVREVILVDQCEPGPGALMAFSLTATSLENQHAWGVGRTMCEVSMTAGDLNFTQEIFVASTALDRAIWYLYREHETLNTIASLVGLDKSNVSRRLNALPLPKDLDAEVNPCDGWREDWFPRLGLEAESDEASEDDCEPPNPGKEKAQRRPSGQRREL